MKVVPFIYACTLFVNVTPVCNQIFSGENENDRKYTLLPQLNNTKSMSFVVVQGYKGDDWIPPYEEWAPLVISIGVGVAFGIFTGIFVALVVVPRQKEKIESAYSPLIAEGEDETSQLKPGSQHSLICSKASIFPPQCPLIGTARILRLSIFQTRSCATWMKKGPKSSFLSSKP